MRKVIFTCQSWIIVSAANFFKWRGTVCLCACHIIISTGYCHLANKILAVWQPTRVTTIPGLPYWWLAGKITGYCAFEWKKDLKGILDAQIAANIHRKNVLENAVVLGGNPRHHRFFVRLVSLIFRLTVAVGTFACLAAVGFLAYWWY